MKIASTDNAEERVIGASGLRVVERLFRAVDSVFSVIPRPLDPMSQTGAVANTVTLVAIVTGIALLVWYVPSVNQAYDSIVSMQGRFNLGGVVRSVHRYSSDAAMMFVFLHAIRTTAERRFGGARWVAWVTGLFSLSMLWFIGWLGYWLVWDEAAQEVAAGTARLVDVVPVFADSLSRTFLTDDGINPLIFFLVFFAHMLLPLGMGVGLWLHISRLRRSRFLAPRALSIAIVLSLIVISIAFPAPLGDRAAMAVTPDGYPMDAWYLAPLALTERMGSAQLWLLGLVLGVFVYSVPWLLVRRVAEKAVVDPAKCDECLKCVVDCPYGAISMVPRSGPNPRHPTSAWVDASLCVGCGICAGSCDSSGIGFTSRPAPKVRLETDAWLGESHDAVVYICDPSMPRDLVVDPITGRAEGLPDCRVVRVSCAGWVHPLTVERALKKGAPAAVIVGCPEGACRYREGGTTTEERLDGKREPSLRTDHVDAAHVGLLREHSPSVARIARAVEAALKGSPVAPRRVPAPIVAALGIVLASALLVGMSNIPWRTSYTTDPRIIVSVKHPGRLVDACRPYTAEELAAMPPHMRQAQNCERGRADLHVRISLNGEIMREMTIEPQGLSGDGVANGMFELNPSTGEHVVKVEVSDIAGATEYNFVSEQVIHLEPRERAVVRFERGQFHWSENDD